MPKTRKAVPILLLTALCLVSAPAATAQLAIDSPAATTRAASPGPGQVIAAQATPSCSGGIVYDDGEADDAVRLNNANNGAGLNVDVVQLFEVGEADRLIEQVCVCWNKIGEPSATFLHELIFYADNNGAPGQRLATVAAQIDSAPAYLTSSFFSYDVSDLDIRNPTENVFIGVSFFGGDRGKAGHALCYDGDASGDQPIFAALAGSEGWTSWQTLVENSDEEEDIDPTIALMIRTDTEEEVAETCPATPCVEDATTLCLNDDRFRVTANWTAPNLDPPTGPAMAPAEELTPDTSYFWFFKDTNVEMVVKVLDACTFSTPRFWVFAGGLTNVEVEMKVCDTQEGIQKTYVNPPETPFQPIQDTNAFATCP